MKKLFLSILLLLSLTGVFYYIHIQQTMHTSSPVIDIRNKKDVSQDDQIRTLLIQLQEEFSTYENTNPQQGYCVTIQTTPNLQAKITPYGGKRTTKLLSGMPENESDYIKKCPFCLYVQDNFKSSRIVKNFNDSTYAVTSLSNQMLVIPQEHYAHLFTTPLETQMIILKNIIGLRNEYANQVKKPIEFHCGSAAGQTIFHLHGRTGIYVQ